jgi:hypothetical protein
MTALGAEGRRFESCLPDHIFRQFSALTACAFANNCGTVRSRSGHFRPVIPGIVPEHVRESFL